ncbi:MAG: uroporphyrinogen decarboxylase family protein [Candidatus Bathyarchaeia archaeon]
MDVRERTLAVLRGEKPDKLPWLAYSFLMPPVGSAERMLRNMGLGLVLRLRVWREEMPNVIVEERTIGNICERIYITPLGKVSTRLRTGLRSFAGGVWAIEPLVKDLRDYEVVEFMIKDTVYSPDYEAFMEAERNLGGDGLAYVRVEPSPFQKLMKDLMGYRNLALGIYRYRRELEALMEVIARKQDELYHIVAESPAEVVLLPENTNSVFTSPELFERYCLPYYKRRTDMLRAKGKIVMAHMDGKLRVLKDLIAKTGFTAVEAFTPPPMGDLSLEEAWATWGDDFPIWVNFPGSVCLLGLEKLREYAIMLVKQGVAHGRMILSVTEDLPPPLVGNLKTITEVVNAYGALL